MKIIGIVGFIGAGKEVAAKYFIEKHDYSYIEYGDIFRKTAKKMGLTTSRSDLQKTRIICDEKHGKDYFPEKVVKTIIKNKLERVVICGIRNPEDAIIPKKIFGKNMVLLFIEADKEKRFKRLKKRASPRDPKSKKEFEEQEKKEFKIYGLKEAENMCDFRVKNNSTVNKFYKNLEQFIIEHNLR
ncbi:AAA family ATPase [Candidatus Aenigmatarchaeota archaeon]